MNKSSSLRSISTANRIDNLPDAILCHILSFLPTKQAATTNVLSKRWKSVWLYVPALDFDDENFKDFPSCRKFIKSTFTLRDKHDSIRSFSFKCGRHSRFTQKQYDAYLKKAMQYAVENLTFNMAKKVKHSKLPDRIFSFKMLQVLKLTNMEPGHFDQLDFPHLKTLHLNSISFISHEDIVKFLLGCPILENLQSQVYPYGIIENLNALPNLVKVRVIGLNTPMALICKTKILHIEEV
ncbi:hypothetical protein TSUD_202610 [Trifolium subterraneum]|uniref:F-box domain-containing protein n=1 Tax=Trifolium subterraneum TaxID=3900 RepID=A0A2Z6LKN4_TRISU|nr:hypothetical protein TSUD_202610 [Trifolium subterraneum]